MEWPSWGFRLMVNRDYNELLQTDVRCFHVQADRLLAVTGFSATLPS